MLKSYLVLILYFGMFALLQTQGILADNLSTDFWKDPRIINGTDANLNATRHQASIRKRKEDVPFGEGHHCGGSLISENVVLSAAHCFAYADGSYLPKEDYIVVMGNLDRFEQNNNTLVFDIEKIITWADYYNYRTLADDLVLLLLNGTVPAEHPTVKPIVLNEGPLINDTNCKVTGWGLTEENRFPNKLRSADVALIDFHDCREKSTYDSMLSEGMLCAGYLKGERDACIADSGGPLVCNGVQAGVVSWGDGCALPLRPGVYTDVAYYKNWIWKQLLYYNGTLPKFASITDGVTNLSSSMVLITFMVLCIFLYDQTK